MKFAGRVWRLLVGIKDGLVLVFMLLFFTALFAVLTARPSPAAVRDGALLLDLSGVVVEERTEIDPIAALLSGTAPVGEYQARAMKALGHSLQQGFLKHPGNIKVDKDLDSLPRATDGNAGYSVQSHTTWPNRNDCTL